MEMIPDEKILLELVNTKMPFGKYAGRYMIDLPEAYVLWFRHKGFPKGRLGELFNTLLVIKVNGLESLVKKSVRSQKYL